jgi:hypothetical protein
MMTAGDSSTERVDRLCNGPLEFLRGVVMRTPMNPNLKFETTSTLDELRDALDVREQHGLEYVFARSIMESCFTPADGGDKIYDFLLDRFHNFDRRRQEMTLPSAELPLIARQQQLERFSSIRRRRVTLFRAIHLAAAIDCDGPWTKSEEKDALVAVLVRVLTGR